MEHKSDGDTNYYWCFQNGEKRFGTRTGGAGNWKTCWDHPNHNIGENDQNTEKSPGDLEETCCDSNSSEIPSANAGGKNSQMRKKK